MSDSCFDFSKQGCIFSPAPYNYVYKSKITSMLRFSSIQMTVLCEGSDLHRFYSKSWPQIWLKLIFFCIDKRRCNSYNPDLVDLDSFIWSVILVWLALLCAILILTSSTSSSILKMFAFTCPYRLNIRYKKCNGFLSFPSFSVCVRYSQVQQLRLGKWIVNIS